MKFPACIGRDHVQTQTQVLSIHQVREYLRESGDVFDKPFTFGIERCFCNFTELMNNIQNGIPVQDYPPLRQMRRLKPVCPGLKIRLQTPAPDRCGATGMVDGRKPRGRIRDSDANFRNFDGFANRHQAASSWRCHRGKGSG